MRESQWQPRGRAWGWAIVAVAILAVVGAVVWTSRGIGGAAGLGEQLRGRARVVLIGSDRLRALAGEGTEIVSVRSLSGVARALEGDDPAALASALDAASVDGLLVDGRLGSDFAEPGELAEQLASYAYVPGLRGVYLAPAAALYERHPIPRMNPPADEAMVRVARGILEGLKPPRVASYPEELREIRTVEVMVMLRQGERARLWRSARGSSIARALNTAAVVARDRWQERQEAMGGPLRQLLPGLTVEVALLIDDGTLGVHTPAFADRVISQVHGVGYERKGTWRYLLPSATQREDSATEAFDQLLLDNGLQREALDRPDMRLYRLVVEELARSGPPGSSATGSSEDAEGAEGANGADAGVAPDAGR